MRVTKNNNHNQSTNKVIMIEPLSFLANPQTTSTNAHQVVDNVPIQEIQNKALLEHQNLVIKLRNNDIAVQLYQGTDNMPDDLFCNNWISFHQDNTLVLYPMYAENRRLECRKDIYSDFAPHYSNLVDLSTYESDNMFLESTGSMVLDRVNKVAYAAISSRTDKTLFLKWCELLAYEPVCFNWHYSNHKSVYHTNVIMFIGSDIIGICIEGIAVENKKFVLSTLQKHHKILELSYVQIESFSGNALELSDSQNNKVLVMSTSAFNALENKQFQLLEKYYYKIIHSDISTIEKYGGGSVRCLLLEVF